MAKASVTRALRVLRARKIDFTDHPCRYEAHGAAAVFAGELGVPEHGAVKRLVMEGGEAAPFTITT